MTTTIPLSMNAYSLPDPIPRVLFIGNQCNFSSCLIATTAQELGGISAAALGSFEDFCRLIEDSDSLPSVLVIDEPTMQSLQDSERMLLLNLPGVSLGLAFSTAEFGRACGSDRDLGSHLTSIFPLNVRLDVWLSIVKLIAHGGSYICPEVMSRGLGVDAPETLEGCGLTQRQLDVLQLVADGQSNKRIADKLGLSIHTVKLHLHNANLRLGVTNRTEAAMRYRALKS